MIEAQSGVMFAANLPEGGLQVGFELPVTTKPNQSGD
jgi:hypothetical protein